MFLFRSVFITATIAAAFMARVCAVPILPMTKFMLDVIPDADAADILPPADLSDPSNLPASVVQAIGGSDLPVANVPVAGADSTGHAGLVGAAADGSPAANAEEHADDKSTLDMHSQALSAHDAPQPNAAAGRIVGHAGILFATVFVGASLVL